MIILLLMAYSVARDALLILPWSANSFALNKDHDIVITQNNGKNFVVKVLPTSLLMPQLTLMNVRTKDQH
ncbi:MAG: hypothetical protein QE262_00540 [Candidatus Methylopumilus sp.]|nr:hypothetical protein [Candidatus Methylopumilus sp.]